MGVGQLCRHHFTFPRFLSALVLQCAEFCASPFPTLGLFSLAAVKDSKSLCTRTVAAGFWQRTQQWPSCSAVVAAVVVVRLHHRRPVTHKLFFVPFHVTQLRFALCVSTALRVAISSSQTFCSRPFLDSYSVILPSLDMACLCVYIYIAHQVSEY